MRLNLWIFREALRKYMPVLHYRMTLGLTVFALIYLAAQTELGRASSGGITPLVAATVVHAALAIALMFQSMMPRIMACERVVRDVIFVGVVLLGTLLLTVLVLCNSDVLAQHLFSVSAGLAGLVFFIGLFRTKILTDTMPWAWHGLHRGLKGAAIFMILHALSTVILSELLIRYGTTGAWVLMRVIWPALGLKLAHVLIITHQLWLRRNAMRQRTSERSVASAAREDSAA